MIYKRKNVKFCGIPLFSGYIFLSANIFECYYYYIFILYSAKSIYSSKRFTIKMYKIATVKLIRNVKFIINIQVKNYATCS